MTGEARPRVAVCGFGRCGSSMLMQMLAAGGIPHAPGAAAGSGEHPSLADALAAAAPGTAVKLLDLPLAARTGDPVHLYDAWQLIWLDRNPRWQAESYRKFARWTLGMRLTVRETRAFRESLERDRPAALDYLTATGHPVLVLTYEDVLRDPLVAALALAGFLPWVDLDEQAAAAVVHARDARTRGDMAVEIAATA